jgi:hypothetical protein
MIFHYFTCKVKTMVGKGSLLFGSNSTLTFSSHVPGSHHVGPGMGLISRPTQMVYQQVGPPAKQSPEYSQYSLNAQRAIKGNVQYTLSNQFLFVFASALHILNNPQELEQRPKGVLIIR